MGVFAVSGMPNIGIGFVVRAGSVSMGVFAVCFHKAAPITLSMPDLRVSYVPTDPKTAHFRKKQVKFEHYGS
jgi:hypothetical protein